MWGHRRNIVLASQFTCFAWIWSKEQVLQEEKRKAWSKSFHRGYTAVYFLTRMLCVIGKMNLFKPCSSKCYSWIAELKRTFLFGQFSSSLLWNWIRLSFHQEMQLSDVQIRDVNFPRFLYHHGKIIRCSSKKTELSVRGTSMLHLKQNFWFLCSVFVKADWDDKEAT